MLKHLKKIIIHKWYVGIECFKKGLYWQGITHDLSKFSPIEFLISIKYYTGKSSPLDEERKDKGSSLAWINHKSKNKHHYHYWIDIHEGECIPVEMPKKYLLEMVCDFIGASKAYNNGSSPLEYWDKHINKKLIHPQTQKDFRELLIKDYNY